MRKRGKIWVKRDGDMVTECLMDIFVGFLGYKVLGWPGIVIVIGIYALGTIINGLRYPSN